MGDTDQPDIERTRRQQTQGAQPGGRAARGPIANPGEAEPGGPVPPYEGRTQAGENAQAGVDKAYDASQAGEPGPGREMSAEEREGVSATDTSAASPHGVGESITQGGESMGPGEDFETLGTKGEAQRPYGKVQPDAESGVGTRENIQEDMPEVLRGDQGG
jgi:hypothetical protein